jgi:hypothetical protein
MRIVCQLNHSDPGATDEYGDHPVGTVTTTDERCYVTQSRRAEEDEIEVERWQVYFLPSTLVDANDTLDVQGMFLQVYGAPWVVIDPVTGYETQIEATAVRRL